LYRIGFGYDVHRLVEGRPLILGGVKIPHELGLMGHSDADVLTHALIDGVLGALARGDIGSHFPDNDPKYKNIDSFILLSSIVDLLKQDGYKINNTDNTIIAQRPKMAPYISSMKDRFSKALEINAEQINIKATTTEGLGFCGQEEGIAAYSVVSLIKSNM